jgi:hypothetical protein
MPLSAPAGSSGRRPDAGAERWATHARAVPAATLHGLARDRLRYALIVREAQRGPLLVIRQVEFARPVPAAAAEPAPARVAAGRPSIAPAPLIIEPVVPTAAPVPPPVVVAPQRPPPPAAAPIAPEAPEIAVEPAFAWLWPAIAASVLIIAGAGWLVAIEWNWLSLPLDRRVSVARALVDGWEGPGAYYRIDGENNRLFGRYLS